MSTIKTFEELDAWKVSRELCNKIGGLIDGVCFGKNFRLIGQIEGSSGSIMDNIAEGFERGTRLEFIQFLGYSKGSCGETRSQLYRALDYQYITQDEFDAAYKMTLEESKMLKSFIQYLKDSDLKGNRFK